MTTRVPCPSCGYHTLSARAADDICLVCYWQDDGQDDESATEAWGGPNKDLSLAQARANYRALGAAHSDWLQRVRMPRTEEL